MKDERSFVRVEVSAGYECDWYYCFDSVTNNNVKIRKEGHYLIRN